MYPRKRSAPYSGVNSGYRQGYRKYVRKLPGRTFRKAQVLNTLSTNTTVPDSLKATLSYSMNATLTGATYSYQEFKVNDLYDPDLTGVGSQPRGYDEYMALYNKFFVRACAVEVMAHSNSSAVPALLICGFSRTRISTEGLSTGDLMTQPGAKYTYVYPTNAMTGAKTLRMYMPLAKLLGRRSLDTDDADVVGSGTTPSTVGYFWVACAPGSGIDVGVRCNLKFYSEFLEKKIIGLS